MTRSKRNGAPSDWLILGVDSGGTKSEVVLADGDGIVLGRGVCAYDDPASGRGPGGSGRTDASVRAAIGRCRSEAGASALAGRNGLGERTLCVVGRGRLPDGSIPSGSFRDIVYRPVREQDGPLALAGAQAGIVVLAGTGAFVYGRTPDGAELHLDSLGPLLGDAGSAFEIGLRAMRASARAPWHRRHATSMARPLFDACAANSGNARPFSMVSYMLEHRDRSEIASLARIVDAHAEAGDAVATRVLEDAADSIAETLRDVVDRLGLADADLPMVAAGSVARRSRIYWARVCRRACEMAPGLRPVVPKLPEVYGVMLAGAATLPGLSPDFGTTLMRSGATV